MIELQSVNTPRPKMLQAQGCRMQLSHEVANSVNVHLCFLKPSVQNQGECLSASMAS